MNIVLCGFKHCGKTTLGRLLAETCDAKFIDTDDVILQQYHQARGEQLTIPQLFKELGEARFRELEHVAIASITHEKNVIVATGGGSLLDPTNVDYLRNIGILVFLDVEFDVLKQRLLANPLPSFVDKENAVADFYALFEERVRIYRQVADVVLPIGHQSNTDIINLLMQYRGHHGK